MNHTGGESATIVGRQAVPSRIDRGASGFVEPEAMRRLTTPLTDLFAPVQDDLAAVARIFDEEAFSELPFVNELCATVRSYRGKMLRPALLLLSGRAAGGTTRAHRTLAAVVELVHMATLVHDDVLDEATERRRRPSINHLAGNTAAVLLGDFLISHAFHLCASLDDQFASRMIGSTTNTVCEGELLQNFHRGRWELTEDDYFEIIRRKTASLTAVCCRLGAVYAGADAHAIKSLEAYGQSAGIAFQIVDDVLDLIGDAKRVGKTLGRDLDLGKATLPLIHCLAMANTSTRAGLIEVLAAGRGSRDDAARVRAWLGETGSIDYALSTAAGYVDDAIARLDVLAPSDARTSLTSLARFIIDRQF